MLIFEKSVFLLNPFPTTPAKVWRRRHSLCLVHIITYKYLYLAPIYIVIFVHGDHITNTFSGGCYKYSTVSFLYARAFGEKIKCSKMHNLNYYLNNFCN